MSPMTAGITAAEEETFWVMLFSSDEYDVAPTLLKKAKPRIAAVTGAASLRPVLSPTYTFPIAKIAPRKHPAATARALSSAFLEAPPLWTIPAWYSISDRRRDHCPG